MKTKLLYFLLGLVISSLIYAPLLVYVSTDNNLTGLVGSFRNSPDELTGKETIERTIPIVAVRSRTQEGVIGNLTIELIPGDATIFIQTNPFVGTSLQYSANTAVSIAQTIVNSSLEQNRDYILDYYVPGNVIGGGSAGAATTIAVLSALTGRQINDSIVVTGTILENGRIGPVGDIFAKAEAAAREGYETFVVPKDQTTLYYYQRGNNPYQIVRQSLDLQTYAKERWDLDIQEVESIVELQRMMLEG